MKCDKQKILRLKKKIVSLQNIVKELRKTKAVTESGLASLQNIAELDISQFLTRFAQNTLKKRSMTFSRKKTLLKGKQHSMNVNVRKSKYPPALRSFAITLYFYSPKAYKYVRSKFCNALPDPRTLRSWYSSVNCEPGFTSESFLALQNKISEAQRKGKQVLVSLMIDEMGIKKGYQCLPNGIMRG